MATQLANALVTVNNEPTAIIPNRILISSFLVILTSNRSIQGQINIVKTMKPELKTANVGLNSFEVNKLGAHAPECRTPWHGLRARPARSQRPAL